MLRAMLTEVLQALRHLGQVRKPFDTVLIEVDDFFDRRFELVLAEQELQPPEASDQMALVLGTVGKVRRAHRQRLGALLHEVMQGGDPLLNQGRVVREVEQGRIDFVADAGDQLAERRHLLGLHQLYLGFLQLGKGVAQILGAGMHALLQRLVELTELRIRPVQLTVAAAQAEPDHADAQQHDDGVNRQHRACALGARNRALVGGPGRDIEGFGIVDQRGRGKLRQPAPNVVLG
jgi:hypothetical protein